MNATGRYRFENFETGDANKFAFVLAKMVAENLGSYNPLVIWGNSGLGKTHLLYAIYNYVKERDPRNTVYLLPCDEFCNLYIDAIKANELGYWPECWNDADLLLIDDIHTLAGKSYTQADFISLFHLLVDRKCQIVLTTSVPLEELAVIDEAFRNEFEGAVLADIAPLEEETRRIIIAKKAEEDGLKLSDEALDYIASQPINDVRLIEGILSRLRAQLDFEGVKITQHDIVNAYHAYK